MPFHCVGPDAMRVADKTRFRWRPMVAGDLDAVEAIAGIVHPNYPEDRAVLDERRRLFPEGCFVLEAAGRPGGYVLSHPSTYGFLPALNTRLGALPDRPDTLYIHDLALLPEMQGIGAARSMVDTIIGLSRSLGLPTVTLTAVNGSEPFWRKHGFGEVQDPALRDRLASYDAHALFMQVKL